MRYYEKCNIVILLLLPIHVEETKLNNRNANDHETAHTGTYNSFINPFASQDIDDYLSLPVHYNARIKGIVTTKV